MSKPLNQTLKVIREFGGPDPAATNPPAAAALTQTQNDYFGKLQRIQNWLDARSTFTSTTATSTTTASTTTVNPTEPTEADFIQLLCLIQQILQDTDTMTNANQPLNQPGTIEQLTQDALLASSTRNPQPNNLDLFAKQLRDDINLYLSRQNLSEFNFNAKQKAAIYQMLGALNPPPAMNIFQRLAIVIAGSAFSPLIYLGLFGQSIWRGVTGNEAKDMPYGLRFSEMLTRINAGPNSFVQNVFAFPGRIAQWVLDTFVFAPVFNTLRLIFSYDYLQPQNKYAFDRFEKGLFTLAISPFIALVAVGQVLSEVLTNVFYRVPTTNSNQLLTPDPSWYGLSVLRLFPKLGNSPAGKTAVFILSLMMLPVDLSVGIFFKTVRGLGIPVNDKFEKGIYILATAVWVSLILAAGGGWIALGGTTASAVGASFVAGMAWLYGPVIAGFTALAGFIAPAAIAIADAAVAVWGAVSSANLAYLVNAVVGRIILSAAIVFVGLPVTYKIVTGTIAAVADWWNPATQTPDQVFNAALGNYNTNAPAAANAVAPTATTPGVWERFKDWLSSGSGNAPVVPPTTTTTTAAPPAVSPTTTAAAPPASSSNTSATTNGWFSWFNSKSAATPPAPPPPPVIPNSNSNSNSNTNNQAPSGAPSPYDPKRN